MLTCTNCGQENPEAARFCLACGQQLDSGAPAGRDERRIVSVVFVDLVGFTARSEALDPEDVHAFLSPYHDFVRREFESFGGVVEKFIGDAIVALFGAPTAYGDDAERAVRAALAVRDGIGELRDLDVQLRIAVNTGEALVSLGARAELGEAMVTGDVVNTASRLQSGAPVNGILVGRETYKATRDAIEYEPAEPVHAKGKAEPVDAWIPLGALHPAGERRHSGELVGRARELEVLRGIWERVSRESVPHLVTVFGPAGMGKTRLAQEFSASVEELGGRTVHGRSLPYRESSASFAFSTQVKELCGIFESDSAEVGLAKLQERVADDTVARHLAILLGLDPEGSVDDREELAPRGRRPSPPGRGRAGSRDAVRRCRRRPFPAAWRGRPPPSRSRRSRRAPSPGSRRRRTRCSRGTGATARGRSARRAPRRTRRTPAPDASCPSRPARRPSRGAAPTRARPVPISRAEPPARARGRRARPSAAARPPGARPRAGSKHRRAPPFPSRGPALRLRTRSRRGSPCRSRGRRGCR